MSDAEPRSVPPFWVTSPLLLALVGLVGTGVGAVLQGFWNTRLEREKFEFSLIEKALAVADKKEAAQNLKFLVDAGLINQFSAEKISALAKDPQALPDFAAPRDVIPPRLGKTALSRVGTYKGAIDDDAAGGGYRRAIADFQIGQGLLGDGIIGPITFDRMKSEYIKAVGSWPPDDATRPKP